MKKIKKKSIKKKPLLKKKVKKIINKKQKKNLKVKKKINNKKKIKKNIKKKKKKKKIKTKKKKTQKTKKIKGHFTLALLDQIKSSIVENKQVILFQNRRGYAPYVECNDCNLIPNCPICAVSLTYHIYQNEIICHYCGYKIFFNAKCEKCQSNEIKTVGLGTEQIAE